MCCRKTSTFKKAGTCGLVQPGIFVQEREMGSRACGDISCRRARKPRLPAQVGSRHAGARTASKLAQPGLIWHRPPRTLTALASTRCRRRRRSGRQSMKRTVVVRPSQVLAARILVERAAVTGREVSPGVKAIAAADLSRRSSRTATYGLARPNGTRKPTPSGVLIAGRPSTSTVTSNLVRARSPTR